MINVQRVNWICQAFCRKKLHKRFQNGSAPGSRCHKDQTSRINASAHIVTLKDVNRLSPKARKAAIASAIEAKKAIRFTLNVSS